MTAKDLRRGLAPVSPIVQLRGTPTPEQVAALVVVLASVAGSAEAGEAAPRRTSLWAERARPAFGPLTHGAGGWRRSALPR
ncbi:acyl-CoA carboxylase subunit epsilon [Micromonospora eburnea]|uniref:Acyl-CoA carboxylase epsilon subunit n=1 Tax=Micromonospora eburnea TaxID=227316 RepID=A0A1C6UWE7_9ACTN|nr:acyl-CoA carboxylase subunit epsilon [Micromonospora eburnea]SCL58340.1 Acyl-CoA carboxylase epsilon subunit [Micromonospora eburnea]